VIHIQKANEAKCSAAAKYAAATKTSAEAADLVAQIGKEVYAAIFFDDLQGWSVYANPE